MCNVKKVNSSDYLDLPEGEIFCDGKYHFRCEKGLLKIVKLCPEYKEKLLREKSFEKSFDNFDETIQPKAVKVAKQYIRDILEGKQGYLIFMGIPGSGKTHLAQAIGNEFIRAELSVLFVRYLEFSRLARESKMEGGIEILYPLINTDILILDDLGSSKPTDSLLEALQFILDERDGEPIIITTNLNKADLKEVFGDKIFSRLLQYGRGVAFEPVDYRRRYGNKRP